MTLHEFALLRLPINGFKTGRRVFYPVCLKQGNKLRPVLFPKRGQGFKTSAADLYKNQILIEYLRRPETEGTSCGGRGGTEGG